MPGTTADARAAQVALRPRLRTQGCVLHFIDTTGPGGAETIFLQIAAGMRDRGWESRTVVVGPGWVLDGLRERSLPVDLVETRGRFDAAYLWKLQALVRRYHVQLIHAHLFSPAVYASLAGAWRGVPVVATFHGASDAEPGGWSMRMRYRLVSRRAAVVCVSSSLAAAVRARTPTGRDVRVIHNGVDARPFAAADGRAVRSAHGIADDVFLVGSLGNMRPAKDYPMLLRAAALMAPERRIAFAIVGERTEPLYGELLALRDRLGVGDRISFWGFRQDVPAVLAAFDALAISSSTEGFSLAAVQAMAAGTPVVATRCGGPEEIITDDVDGLLVPAGDPEALAASVRQLADSAALRERLTAAARRTSAARFSIEAMLDSYERLYRERIEAASS